MKEKLQQFKNSPALKAIAAIIMLMIAYKIYIWTQTESTDNAYIEADISTISSEVNGRVSKVFILDNQPVKVGDIIAEIEDTDYAASFQKASSALEIAENNLKITERKIEIQKIDIAKLEDNLGFLKINFDMADRERARTSKLAADNFSSARLLDGAKLAAEKAKSELAQVIFGLDSANQNLLLLRLQKSVDEAGVLSAAQNKVIADHALKNTKIVSPIEGILANNSIKVGNFLRAGAPIVAVVPVSGLYIKANFKETQVAKFTTGSKVTIEADAVPGVKFNGFVRNISPASGSKFSLIPPDNATGNFTKVVQRIPVLIDFEIPAKFVDKLKAGMSVTVSVRH
jgi:membrane fusion protein (multidrug efflux system)